MSDLNYNLTFREKDKGWQCIVSYKEKSGKWKQKSKQGFKTKREAKAKRRSSLYSSNRYGKRHRSTKVKCIPKL